MPRVLKTIVPRIRKSIQERGFLASLGRSILLPVHILREYRESRRPARPYARSRFDQDHGLETDGDREGWTYLSDLDISSPNWIHGTNYAPIEPDRFRSVLATLPIKFEDFLFIDFGSGKGRALLLACDFPFKQIVGVEFSPQLHAVAERNIASSKASQTRRTPIGSVCMDFLEFPLPPEPSVFFFFDPCDETVLDKMLARISESMRLNPRESYLVYVAPPTSKERLLDSTSALHKLVQNAEEHFCVYKLGGG
jgi:hypothetical protein